MNNVKQEIIGDTSQVKGTEKIEVVKQESIQSPDYSYGLNQNSIDGSYGVRNIKSVSNAKIGSFLITSTGIITVTGLGFTPSLVKFDVVDQITTAGTGAMTATSQYAVNYALSTQVTSNCIYYGSPVKARAVLVSIDADGFTINCTYFTTNTYVNYVAS